jgi:DNA-binding LytR/AlgR family response regulator
MLTSLIVNPNERVANELQELLASSSLFGRSRRVKSLEEAHDVLKCRSEIDIVFVTLDFPSQAIAALIQNANTKLLAVPAAFILLLKPDEQTTSTVAKKLVFGATGFLCEPYSKSAVEEIASIADRLTNADTKIKLTAATGLLLSTASNDGSADGHSGSIVERINNTLKNIQEASGSTVIQEVFDKLQEYSPSRKKYHYSGPSMRVKRLLEKKAEKENS